MSLSYKRKIYQICIQQNQLYVVSLKIIEHLTITKINDIALAVFGTLIFYDFNQVLSIFKSYIIFYNLLKNFNIVKNLNTTQTMFQRCNYRGGGCILVSPHDFFFRKLAKHI